MQTKLFLEDIVKQEQHRIRRPPVTFKEHCFDILHGLDPFLSHPVLTAAGTYIAINLFGNDLVSLAENTLSLKIGHLSDNDLKAVSLGTSYVTYFITSTLRDYYLDGKRLVSKGKNLAERTYNFVLEHPKITTSIVLASYLTAIPYIVSTLKSNTGYTPRILKVIHGFIGLPLAGIASEFFIYGLRNTRRIKKAIRKLKTKTYEKIWNFAFEHPVLLGALSGLYIAYTHHQEIHKNSPTVQRLGANFDLVNVLGSSLAGIAVSSALMLSGSVLHTHSLRSSKYRISSAYYRLIRQPEKAIESQRVLVSLPDSLERKIENLIDLGNLHYEQGKEKEAFAYYRQATRLFDRESDSIGYLEFFRKTFGIARITRFFKKQRKDSVYSSFIDLLNKDQTALEKLKTLVTQNPDDFRLRYLYGKALGILGFKESGRIQKLKAASMCLKQGTKLHVSDESKRKVILFDDPFLGEEVIAKENQTEEPLEKEIALTERVRKSISDKEEYETPTPIGILEVDNKFWYVMERAEGELLKERVERGTSTLYDFLQVADFMALFHARINPDEALPERDYKHLMKERLTTFCLPQTLVSEITRNIDPIINYISVVKKVYNKDSHFSNWLFPEYGGVMALDIEEGRLIPIAFETANLTCYHRTLNELEQEELIKRHRETFERETGEKIPEKDFKLAYLNSRIVAAFEMYSRQNLSRNIRQAALDNALGAISRIETNFKQEYIKHSSSYASIRLSLASLSSLLSSQDA